jgi:hypothetical protein
MSLFVQNGASKICRLGISGSNYDLYDIWMSLFVQNGNSNRQGVAAKICRGALGFRARQTRKQEYSVVKERVDAIALSEQYF